MRFVGPLIRGRMKQVLVPIGAEPTPYGTFLHLRRDDGTPNGAEIGEATLVYSETIVLRPDHDLIRFGVSGINMNGMADLDEFASRSGFQHWRDLRAAWKASYPDTYAVDVELLYFGTNFRLGGGED